MTLWKYVVIPVIALAVLGPYLIPVSRAVEERAQPYDNSQFFDLDQGFMHYRLWLPDKPVRGKVLLIHGMGGSTFSWREQVDTLVSHGFLTLAVDLPGFGYSSRDLSLSHSQKQRAQWLAALMQHIDANLEQASTQEWSIVGHSMGGGTAVALGLEAQDRISSLVLVAGALFNTQPAFARIFLSLPPFKRYAMVLMERVFLTEERLNGFLESAYGRKVTDEELKGYVEPLLLKGTIRSLLRISTSARNVSVSELSSISLPVFAVWGEEDSWVPVENLEKMKDVFLNFDAFIIAGAAHCPMETHREEFNSILLQIVTEKID